MSQVPTLANDVDPLIRALHAYQARQRLSSEDLCLELRLSSRSLTYLYSSERKPDPGTLGLILRLPIVGVERLVLDYLRNRAIERVGR